MWQYLIYVPIFVLGIRRKIWRLEELKSGEGGGIEVFFVLSIMCYIPVPRFHNFNEGTTTSFEGDPPHLTLNHSFQVIQLS